MNSEGHHYEQQLINDLIREVSEVGRLVRTRKHLTYAFDPIDKPEKDIYYHNMMLMTAIYDLLNECSINIKSRGYTYIKDAVCIITDHDTLDVCLSKDIYPYIARKHGINSIGRVEHNIRNSINAAYRLYVDDGGKSSQFLGRFKSKPTPKEFLLHMKEEVDRRLWNELSGC